LAADAAVLLSLLLQHAPASLIGAVVDELHATERQHRSAS
jgi:hypothetical protein